MGRLKKLCLGGALLGLVVVMSVLLLSSCEEPAYDFAPERDFGRVVFARGGIKNIRKFKDQSYIHGLNYFYFQADPPEVNRLISWLELEKVEKIPSPESQVVEDAVSQAGWKFAWATAQVYLSYWCNPPDAEGRISSVDLLLVSQGEGIYVTQGYRSIGATRTNDPSRCGPQ